MNNGQQNRKCEMKSSEVKALRNSLGLSQFQFSVKFRISLTSIRNWEQGRCVPDVCSRTLLHLIKKDAQFVADCVKDMDI